MLRAASCSCSVLVRPLTPPSLIAPHSARQPRNSRHRYRNAIRVKRTIPDTDAILVAGVVTLGVGALATFVVGQVTCFTSWCDDVGKGFFIAGDVALFAPRRRSRAQLVLAAPTSAVSTVAREVVWIHATLAGMTAKRTRRHGASETIGISVDRVTKRNLKKLAAERFAGNVSALVTEMTADAVRRAAFERAWAWYGGPAPSATERSKIDREIEEGWRHARKTRRRAAA